MVFNRQHCQSYCMCYCSKVCIYLFPNAALLNISVNPTDPNVSRMGLMAQKVEFFQSHSETKSYGCIGKPMVKLLAAFMG